MEGHILWELIGAADAAVRHNAGVAGGVRGVDGAGGAREHRRDFGLLTSDE